MADDQRKEAAEPKKRVGRPRKGVRGTFSFRVTEDLRAKLEALSRSEGRPVSEIIEARLKQSFERSGFHAQAEIVADVIAHAVTRSAGILEDAPLATPKERRYTFKRVSLALSRLAEALGNVDADRLATVEAQAEAEQIEAMAAEDDERDKAARDRWSLAFGAWSEVLANTRSSAQASLEELRGRAAADPDSLPPRLSRPPRGKPT